MKIVCVTGYRNYMDEQFVHNKLTELYGDIPVTYLEIITGECNCKEDEPDIGVDYFAKQWAIKNGHTYNGFEADWTQYGKRAGPIRNTEMADYLEQARRVGCEVEVVAFIHPKSRGTKDMCEKARGRRIHVDDYKIK